MSSRRAPHAVSYCCFRIVVGFFIFGAFSNVHINCKHSDSVWLLRPFAHTTRTKERARDESRMSRSAFLLLELSLFSRLQFFRASLWLLNHFFLWLCIVRLFAAIFSLLSTPMRCCHSRCFYGRVFNNGFTIAFVKNSINRNNNSHSNWNAWNFASTVPIVCVDVITFSSFFSNFFLSSSIRITNRMKTCFVSTDCEQYVTAIDTRSLYRRRFIQIFVIVVLKQCHRMTFALCFNFNLE